MGTPMRKVYALQINAENQDGIRTDAAKALMQRGAPWGWSWQGR